MEHHLLIPPKIDFKVEELNMYQSDELNELAAALAKCQAEMKPAIKDSVNPFFKSKYSDLNSVWEACREPLSNNGLSVVQTMQEMDGKFQLVTTLLHSSGQWMKSYFPILVQKQDAQSYGSACSYARRYSLSSITGCTTADEDDDGEKAGRAEYINKNQQDELTCLFEACDPEYVERVWKTLRKDGIDSVAKITVSILERLKKASITNMKQYQASKETNPSTDSHE